MSWRLQMVPCRGRFQTVPYKFNMPVGGVYKPSPT